ncbi:hypothetical protein [Specibacter cremeus]|uniref:hypothetical protein n=1 Tax=Specibacter cremeus TaxID=1629051 RepID=UPI000F7AB05C|nr:hypothetical protein [Specibacter cremeus]
MRDGLYLGGVSLPFVSSLRIYLPLDAYTPAQAAYIRHHLMADQNRVAIDAQELADSLARIGRADGNPLPSANMERVRVLRLDEDAEPLYSPTQVLTRSAVAALALFTGGTAQLARLVMGNDTWPDRAGMNEPSPWPHDRTQTRTSNWGIPFSWFTLISARDRTEVVEASGRVLTVRVQVPTLVAAKRSGDMLALLAESAPDLDLFDELEDLHEWLEGYDDRGIVELDYGPVGNRVYPDESPLDVRMGLECLAEGDLTGAAAAYRRLASRWIPIRQLARAN